MSTDLQKQDTVSAIEQALIGGDLGKLSPHERLSFYKQTCQSLGLNPLTKPFAYITLNGKLTLYALKDCTEQLRNIHSISLSITSREVIDGVYVVSAKASRPDGRADEATGAVPIDNLKGEAKANAYMKAETKAKRRVTLSICGLGILDESETGSIPGARVEGEDMSTEGIDTGGHAVGTQAAANHVAQRKLEEIKADIPDALIVLFDSLGEKGKVTEAFTDMKSKFEAAWPNGHGVTTYQRICVAHGIDKGKPTIAQVKSALMEMWKLLQQVVKPEPETAEEK